MRADDNVFCDFEKLLEEFEVKAKAKRKAAESAGATSKTYLRHASTFFRWFRGNYEAGEGR